MCHGLANSYLQESYTSCFLSAKNTKKNLSKTCRDQGDRTVMDLHDDSVALGFHVDGDIIVPVTDGALLPRHELLGVVEAGGDGCVGRDYNVGRYDYADRC